MSPEELFLILFDACMGAAFLLLGFAVRRSKGRAGKYIAGYRPKDEYGNGLYDAEELCRDYGNKMMRGSLILFAGAVLGFFTGGIGCMAAFLVFVILVIVEFWKDKRII